MFLCFVFIRIYSHFQLLQTMFGCWTKMFLFNVKLVQLYLDDYIWPDETEGELS